MSDGIDYTRLRDRRVGNFFVSLWQGDLPDNFFVKCTIRGDCSIEYKFTVLEQAEQFYVDAMEDDARQRKTYPDGGSLMRVTTARRTARRKP